MTKINEGILYGYGLFETLKIVKGNPINLYEHFNRMKNSSMELNIEMNLDFEKFKKIVTNEIAKNFSDVFVLRINLLKNKGKSQIFFNKRDYVYTSDLYERGYDLNFSSVLRNETSKILYHKTFNYLENFLELETAKAKGYDETIFLNTKGYISECSTCNIFIINKEKIYTPKIENGILNGIIREQIIDKVKKIGIEVCQENISKDFLLKGEEVFLTNSLIGIMPVRKIENKIYKKNFIEKIKKTLSL